MRVNPLEKAKGRTALVRTGFAVLFLILVVRVGEISMWKIDTANKWHFTKTSQSKRGDIFDSRGVLLATNIMVKSLYADPRLVSDPKNTAKRLAAIFKSLDEKSVAKKLQSRARFVWIKRHITPAEEKLVKMIGEPGLSFRDEQKRFYPQKSLMAHIVGYTDIDTNGLSGVELSQNDILENGGNITLSIDLRLQHVLRKSIIKAISEFSAKSGSGIIMDVQDRHVLAAVSLPDFDLNDGRNASSYAKFNRFSLGVYELGSVFKIFSISAFLQATKNGMNETFDARKPIKRGRFTIRDFHPEKRKLSTTEVFVHSSNIGTALMAEEIGSDELTNFYKSIGLFSAPNFPIKEVGSPIIPNPWRDINTLTASYGHGIAVSLLQVAVATCAIVGDGSAKDAVLIIGDNPKNNAVDTKVISSKTTQSMRRLMGMVVGEGTGKLARVDGQSVGGKTGTAEQPSARGGYDRKKLISSFVGIFPSDNPRYLVVISVNSPSGTKKTYGYATGGWVAAPAVARTIEGMVDILGIPSEESKGAEK